MTSKNPKKDWYPATKISFAEEPPSREVEDPGEMYGYYDIRRQELWVDPKVEELTEDENVQRTRHGTLAHEIGHFKLRHKHLNLFPGQSQESKEEFFGPILGVSKRMGPLDADHLAVIRDEVHELEVRLLQEVGGWAQDPGDDFIMYFDDLLELAHLKEEETGNRTFKKLVIAMGRQAINNLTRQGHLSEKQSSQYLIKINKLLG